jgi:nucleotide-binding universal stress UspA family protein
MYRSILVPLDGSPLSEYALPVACAIAMYRSILVPLDGSPLSEYALPVACAIARRSGAALRLVHVHMRATSNPIYVEGLPVIDEHMQSLNTVHERVYLERIRDRIIAEQDRNVTIAIRDPVSDVGRDVTVADALAADAAATNTDLVVMTTHGRGGLARFWLGSVADTLVHLSSVPVLSLRPAEPVPPIDHPPVFRHILIPLDGSALAEQILEPALALGDLTRAAYTLLHVVEPFVLPGYAPLAQHTHLDTQLTQAALAKGQRYLDDLAQHLRTDGRQVHTRALLAAQPAAEILDTAQAQSADLIALATHGRSGLARLLLGSVADKVRRGADMPVLLYRPQVSPTADRVAEETRI